MKGKASRVKVEDPPKKGMLPCCSLTVFKEVEFRPVKCLK